MEPNCFLTIITRCNNRPGYLRNNVRSVKTLVDKDHEQIFIIDRKGLGLAAADKILDKFKNLNTGKYIMVLDDDDLIVDKKLINYLKDEIRILGYEPDIFIWRGKFTRPTCELPPLNENWGNRVVRTKIGSFNYAIKKELYNQHICKCASGVTGDFDFLDSILNSIPKPSIVWIKKILVACQDKLKGKQAVEIETIGNKRIIRRKNRWKKKNR